MMKLDQKASLGNVIYKGAEPVYEYVPQFDAQGKQVMNQWNRPQMMRSEKVIGTKYFLACSALEGKDKDIEVTIEGDTNVHGFEDFEPVVLEGIEMNYYSRRDDFNVTVSYKAKSIRSAAPSAKKGS